MSISEYRPLIYSFLPLAIRVRTTPLRSNKLFIKLARSSTSLLALVFMNYVNRVLLEARKVLLWGHGLPPGAVPMCNNGQQLTYVAVTVPFSHQPEGVNVIMLACITGRACPAIVLYCSHMGAESPSIPRARSMRWIYIWGWWEEGALGRWC